MPHKNNTYVAYFRVSTKLQGISGLGLEAQQKTVTDYVSKHGGEILQSYTEIETGTSKRRRVEVYKAISQCREQKATLIVAKLDRLARDVEFIAAVQKMNIDIVFCDLPGCNKMMIGVMSVIASYEATLISERTKAGLAALQSRGVKLGNPKIGLYSAAGHAARNRTPDPNSPNTQAVGMILSLRGSGKTYEEIAKALNHKNMRTTYDKAFTKKRVEVLYLNEKKKMEATK